MSEDTSIRKVLNDILETQSFDKLGNFTDSQLWGTMSLEERTLLAKLFILAGESELKEPKSEDPVQSAKKLFTTASNLAPNDAAIWYRRGLAFSTHEDKALLEEASLCLEKATSLDNSLFDAWFVSGTVLMRRVNQPGDSNYYFQAEEKFLQAEKRLDNPELHKEFYWQFGLLYFMIGRASGEAVDLHRAIQCYRKAKDVGLSRLDFYNDFANALVELALLINNHEMLFEAIEHYLYSLDNEDVSGDKAREMAIRYCNLGACYQYLFELHHEETFFKQAEECFQQATNLQNYFGNAWAFWGYLLLYAAKLWQDANYLEASLEKLSRLADFAEDKSLLLARMAEAFALYGSHEEDLKLLTDAEELAHKAIETGPDVPYAWAAIALTNLELGRYFNDDSYYHKAIEKAEQGLQINQKIGICWHVLAVCKFHLAESQADIHLMEEAIVAFQWASNTDVGRFGYMWNDWGITFLNLADITQEQKFVQEAIEKFEQAILLHDKPHPSWLVNLSSALIFLADLTDEEAYYEKAIDVLKSALSIDPTSIQARYHLGLAYSHLGEQMGDLASLKQAIEHFQVCLNEDMEDDASWNDLGMCFMYISELTNDPADSAVKESLYDLAEQHFLQSLALGNSQVFYSLACLSALRNHIPDAMGYLEKAYETNTLPLIEDMIEDEWLENARQTAYFQAFMQRLRGAEEDN